MSGSVIFVELVLVPLLILIWVTVLKAVKVVKQGEVMIIERFGKFKTVLRPGLYFLIPFVEKPRTINWKYLHVPIGKKSIAPKITTTDRIDIREHCLDFGKQNIITKDTVTIEIDALVYYKIVDPYLAVYSIQNLPDAIELLTQTTLRNIMAHLNLDDTFSSREWINTQLLENIKKDAERWGVDITRVEVQTIDPPGDVKQIMETQIRQERERRAQVLTAEGDRQASIVKSLGTCAKMVIDSEAYKTTNVNNAKGEAQAKTSVANAEAEAIIMLREAIIDQDIRATDYMVAVQYLSHLQQLASGSVDVVLLPLKTVDSIEQIMSMNK